MIQSGDFYEDDEPVADVEAAFDRGTPAVSRSVDEWAGAPCWFCPHWTITASMVVIRPTVGCGCEMTPGYATI
jgi:hypothetical protein